MMKSFTQLSISPCKGQPIFNDMGLFKMNEGAMQPNHRPATSLNPYMPSSQNTDQK